MGWQWRTKNRRIIAFSMHWRSRGMKLSSRNWKLDQRKWQMPPSLAPIDAVERVSLVLGEIDANAVMFGQQINTHLSSFMQGHPCISINSIPIHHHAHLFTSMSYPSCPRWYSPLLATPRVFISLIPSDPLLASFIFILYPSCPHRYPLLLT